MTTTDDLDDLELLLPFYVNGTLSLGERARIEAALADSAYLRQQLNAVQHLSIVVKQGGEAMVAGASDPEKRLERLSARLDDLAPQSPDADVQVFNDTPPRLSDLLGYLNPARWHPAVSLALALAVLAQTVFIWSRPSEQSYQTVSGDDEQVLATASQLIVRLKPQAQWEQVEALLSAHSLTIISGPSEGRITVRLDNPDADVKVVREKLRQSPDVAFADLLK